MSIIEDFHKLPFQTKSLYLSILGTMPFFFCAIYLFQPEWIIKGQEYIAICFSFCFSIVWYIVVYILNLFLSIILKQFNKLTKKDFDEKKGKEYHIICYLFSIVLIIASITKNYYEFNINNRLQSFELKLLKSIAYSYGAALLGLILIKIMDWFKIYDYFKKRSLKKRKNKSSLE
jgi:hypothetical protein